MLINLYIIFYTVDNIAENENEDQHSISFCDRDGITALGMESGQIPDSALTASSAYEMLHVGPHNAR